MMRNSLIFQRVRIVFLLLLAFVALGVEAAITIHSQAVLGSTSEYCNYCHLDSVAPDPLKPKIWRGEDQGVLCLCDGVSNYISFNSNSFCLRTSRTMTVEARIKPTGIADVPYIKRILALDVGGNYQLSVWRGDPAVFPAFTPPTGVASIALWLKPVDSHGGNAWKPVLTNYSAYPIQSDHWYRVKAVWNSDKFGGITNQPYVHADIFIDDEGTDGLGTGESWTGYRNATDDTQGYLDAARLLYTADEISTASGLFSIGVNANNHANHLFEGQIDWLTWEDVADYMGVDDPPN